MAYRKLAVSLASAFSAGFGATFYMLGNNKNDKKDSIVTIDSPIFTNLINRMTLQAKVNTNQKSELITIQPETKLNLSEQINEVMKHGFPTNDNVRVFEDYVLSYDTRNRVPNWVFERLTETSVTKGPGVKRSPFKTDPQIHDFFKSTDSDYKGSGFDR